MKRYSHSRNWTAILIASFAVNAGTALGSFAQSSTSTTTAPAPEGYLSRFVEPAATNRLDVALFGGGFISDNYGTLQEGFQLEQTVTRSVGLVGRFTGYQLFVGSPLDDPLAPGTGHRKLLNFGRFQGGVDLALAEGTNLFILGGGDGGDSHAGVIEGDLNSWFFLSKPHPLNLAIGATYDSQNSVTCSAINLRLILTSNDQYVVAAGAGGAIYGGGFVPSVEGQGGAILGIYFPRWKLGFDGQAGYGDAKQYGQLSIFKALSFDGL